MATSSDRQAVETKGAEDSRGPIRPQEAEWQMWSWSFISTYIALALSVFCVALDNTIIATAVPRITDDFKAIKDIGWYGSAYLLPTCAFQLMFGRLYSRYSAKWTFMVALFFFEVGSLVCAVAPTSTAFIIGRAIQGIGAAGVFSGAMLIVGMIVPRKHVPAFQSMVGVMFGVSSIVAPLTPMLDCCVDLANGVGCFYINLPIGGVSAVLLLFFLRVPSKPRLESFSWQLISIFDPVGLALFLASIICLLLALEWGDVVYPWSDWRLIVVLVFFAVCLIGFVVDQLAMEDNATIPPRLARQRTLASMSFFMFCLFGYFSTILYFIPIYFQAIKSASAEGSGIRMIPFIVANVIASVLAGVLVSKTGHYLPFFYASSVISSLGAGLISTFQVDTSAGEWIGYQILIGVGAGLAFQLPPSVIQLVLKAEDVPVGLASNLMLEFLGGSVFVSAANNLFNSRLRSYIDALEIPGVQSSDVVSGGATSLQDIVPAEDLPRALRAYMEALRWPFRLSLILACLGTLGVVAMERRTMRDEQAEVQQDENGSAVVLSPS
ncbi:unnamed protein product, partial [Aureobasidium vineae]